MTRLRLATLLSALLALAGGAAGPAGSPASTQLVAAIVQVTREPGRVARERRRSQVKTSHPIAEVAAVARAQPLRTTDLPHSLFQRPPPSRS